MPKRYEDVGFDVEQIEEERRKTLELILIVFVLGLLLNCTASGAYSYFDVKEQEYVLFWVSLITSSIALVLFVRLGLLRPVKKHSVIPIVFFYDNSMQTVSVPKEIHHPSKSRIPFSLLSRPTLP